MLVERSTRVVLPEGERSAALHIVDGVIERIVEYASDDPTGAKVFNAADLVVSPGLVDTHVHINEPGRAEWEGFDAATRAGAAGGVTTLVDMPLNCVPATTSVSASHAKVEAARAQCHVDVGFWGGVVPGNAAELDALVDAGVRGFKCLLAPWALTSSPPSPRTICARRSRSSAAAECRCWCMPRSWRIPVSPPHSALWTLVVRHGRDHVRARRTRVGQEPARARVRRGCYERVLCRPAGSRVRAARRVRRGGQRRALRPEGEPDQDCGAGLARRRILWAQQEQAGAADATEATRRRLAEANREYEARSGYISIVCATGRTAGEMLELLERRLRNDPGGELGVAAEEQRKIIRLRLTKLVETEQVTTK